MSVTSNIYISSGHLMWIGVGEAFTTNDQTILCMFVCRRSTSTPLLIEESRPKVQKRKIKFCQIQISSRHFMSLGIPSQRSAFTYSSQINFPYRQTNGNIPDREIMENSHQFFILKMTFS